MNVIFRCDANKNIGVGHAKRCFALAEALRQKNCPVYLLCQTMPESLLAQWKKIGAEIEMLNASDLRDDALQTLGYAKGRRGNWIVVDGYKFDAGYFDAIQNSASINIMAVVDEVQTINADIILNQNPGADLKDQPKSISGKYLLGERFIMLRQEFREAADKPRKRIPGSIVLTMGGSDSQGVTMVLLELLKSNFSEINIEVIVGPANPYKDILQAKGKGNSEKITMIVDPDNMAEIFARNYLAVFAAGSTSWELAALGVPGVCVILADNQINIARTLEERQFAYNMGWYHQFEPTLFVSSVRKLLDDPTLYQARASSGKSWVDGKGVYRIIQELESYPTKGKK